MDPFPRAHRSSVRRLLGSPRSIEEGSPHERPVVFLAEDDADLRALLARALDEGGFEVISASDGRDMLRILTAASRREIAPPDAFVMDIRMPRCSGLDVLGALRMAEWSQPVVMITAFGDPMIHEKAASYGASVVLDKPLQTEELIAMLDLLLRFDHGRVLRRRAAANDVDDEEPDTLPSPTGAPPKDGGGEH